MITKYLVHDPLATRNSGLEEYTDGFITGMNFNGVETFYITNYHSNSSHKNKSIYFPFSEKIKNLTIRRFIRSIEYVLGHMITIYLIIKTKPEKIHFIWLVLPQIDFILLKVIKILIPQTKIIYTAHNIVPHNGVYSKKSLKLFYNNCDLILTHSKLLSNLLANRFEIANSKIFSIFHGAKSDNIEAIVPDELNKTKKYLCIAGLINKNKGVFRLLKLWKEMKNNQYNLIIAGKINDPLVLNWLNNHKDSSITLINRFLTKEEFHGVLKVSDWCLLPYLNGSVSGVLFNSAIEKTPIISTNFGGILEYIKNEENSFCEPDWLSFENRLKTITNYNSKIFGEKLHKHIFDTYNWNHLTFQYIKWLERQL